MTKKNSAPEILEFKHVSFGYNNKQMILKDACLRLEEGKTYALVGPTGGGKSTTASLMVRLFDPTEGVVEFKNRDIRTYQPHRLAQSIGFILQEPFLFSGTVAENIVYGNPNLSQVEDVKLLQILEEYNLQNLSQRFEKGLQTQVQNNANNISLGQKQLIAFMRILLRTPELLIMDEATANIDTLTEHLLDQIIAKLPTNTTKVIIAHRLNTIKSADEILFINDGRIQPASDFEDVINLINTSDRKS